MGSTYTGRHTDTHTHTKMFLCGRPDIHENDQVIFPDGTFSLCAQMLCSCFVRKRLYISQCAHLYIDTTWTVSPLRPQYAKFVQTPKHEHMLVQCNLNCHLMGLSSLNLKDRLPVAVADSSSTSCTGVEKSKTASLFQANCH